MTEAKRITLNTLASYMKSIVTLPLNLLSARWVLAALGTDDFGLYGLVGGVVFFITFINAVSSQAVARFYAFSIGRAKTPHHEQDLKQWFNTALSIHVLLPVFVLVTGYPVGVYAINHWLVIPPDRTLLAVRIFQIALAQAFFAMVIVPYVALYVAHQFITNLTVFTILTSVLNAALAFGLVHMEGGRVYVYAVGMLTILVLLGLAQVAYARRRFNDARVRFSMMFNWNRMREMLSFTWWRFLASCGWMLRTQGSGFVANSYCGVTANAAISVSNQLSAQTAAFSAHLVNAFMPAVVTSAGANQTKHTAELAFRGSKFSSLLVVLFGIPMILCCDEILTLWLKNPPNDAAYLCAWLIGSLMVEKLTAGQENLLTAYGKMAAWQTCEAFANVLALCVCWFLLASGRGVASVGLGFMFATVLIGLFRLYFANRIAHSPICCWLRAVLLPVSLVSAVAWGVGTLIYRVEASDIVRVCWTVAGSFSVTLLATWFLALDRSERTALLTACRVVRKFAKIFQQ